MFKNFAKETKKHLGLDPLLAPSSNPALQSDSLGLS
jgi:hypothetical protein